MKFIYSPIFFKQHQNDYLTLQLSLPTENSTGNSPKRHCKICFFLSFTKRIVCVIFFPDPEVHVDVPSFSGKSFIELYKLEAYSRLSLEMDFKTFSNDGILLYNGQTASSSGDFVAITLKDGFVEFRLGSFCCSGRH